MSPSFHVQAAKAESQRRQAVAAAAQAAEKLKAVTRAAAQQLPYKGPHLEPAADTLTLHTTAGPTSMATGELSITSTGTMAVYYNWECGGQEALPGGATRSSSSSSQGQSAVAVATAPLQQMFFMPDVKGVILPGETKQFRFSFTSQQPGMFSQVWYMHTQPPLAAAVSSSSSSSSQGIGRRKRGEPITVRLRGMAVAKVDGKMEMATQALAAKMAKDHRDRKVRNVAVGNVGPVLADGRGQGEHNLGDKHACHWVTRAVQLGVHGN